MIYLSTAIGITPGGSGTVYIYTQTIHGTTQTQTIHRTQITTNLEVCGPCPIFASFTPAFALQLRKKHGKTSVRVEEERPYTYCILPKHPHITNLHTHTHTHTRPHITKLHTHTRPHIWIKEEQTFVTTEYLQRMHVQFVTILRNNPNYYCFNHITFLQKGTRWRSWLGHCATSRKVAGSIPDGVTGIFHRHNPSGRTMNLGLTQPLTVTSTRNIFWG